MNGFVINTLKWQPLSAFVEACQSSFGNMGHLNYLVFHNPFGISLPKNGWSLWITNQGLSSCLFYEIIKQILVFFPKHLIIFFLTSQPVYVHCLLSFLLCFIQHSVICSGEDCGINLILQLFIVCREQLNVDIKEAVDHDSGTFGESLFNKFTFF